jgi:hypothetical protein
MEEPQGLSGTELQPEGGGPMTIEVDNTTELINALRPGATILLKSKEYSVDTPLLVPDGATLKGAGEMRIEGGLPRGFRGTATRISAKRGLKGNLVTLSNDSKLQQLVLEGLPRRGGVVAGHVPEDDAGRGGNVIAVASRAVRDNVKATIEKCQLISNIDSGVGTDGPTGGAILAYTRNPEQGANPPPHVGAEVTVEVTQSILDAPKDGKAILAMNFASGGKVTINLTQNNIRGPLDVMGGLSRPDAVVGATTTIDSDENLYRPSQQSDAAAWQIVGGSTPPFPAGPNSNSDSNTASANSKKDQIADFEDGIVAIGGRRLSIDNGSCSGNRVNLKLTQMKLATSPQEVAADFVFVGALSLGPFSAGDANIVCVHVEEATGSGPRNNLYADSQGSGTGNQLRVKGSPSAFAQSNPGIDPAPPNQFFRPCD